MVGVIYFKLRYSLLPCVDASFVDKNRYFRYFWCKNNEAK